ncbi:hypothetical protein LTR62_005364 [Meristemomyces frigidus]|uniref:DUF1857-domain-containing protein n=1 Tax=Meristemomyces frigidus TaxID=1508187 RepID=A0AAN7TDY0_9PEZI|nr:hypothetical protein LTR62_005364 [Meristemomyces frigidus]
MVTLHIASTAPINPINTTPALTRTQVWQGLQRKIRQAQDFVPVILNTEVLSDQANEVIRVATFAIPGKSRYQVREVCISYEPTRVDFLQPDGAVITNTISDGPGGQLFMTYTFEFRYPDIHEGSEEAGEKRTEHVRMAAMAVESSIKAMRRMVEKGELGN